VVLFPKLCFPVLCCMRKSVLSHSLPCTVVYCHVLPCTAVYCRVLPCIVVYCHVLSCTAMYCRVLPCTVVYCHMQLSQIGILVLDESHHCASDHPYAQLMEDFYHTCDPASRPQILGLTASPSEIHSSHTV
jgi:hypothetical protein